MCRITTEDSKILLHYNKNKIENGLEFLSINRTKVCAKSNITILTRKLNSVSQPDILICRKIIYRNNSIIFKNYNKTNSQSVEFKIQGEYRRIKFSILINSKDPIWLTECKFSGLELDKILVPALGGQVISKNMPDGTSISYKYPFWWNAQFVIGMLKEGGIIFRIEDSNPNLKLLRVEKEKEKFSITIGFESNFKDNKREFYFEWYLEAFEGSWKKGVDIHRNWMERTYNLIPWKNNKLIPLWAKKIKFILELWGARKDREEPMHTFRQMIYRLDEWKKNYNPENTLVYLPGFAEHGIDSNAPSYNPSKQCGGEKDFKKLVDYAHQLGYKIMIHTNAIAMTFEHPLYERFKKYQVIDVFDRMQGWALDIDGDWLTEPFFAYINPGYQAWGDLMVKIIGSLISKFKIDAVFLDQTLLAFNVKRGPNFILGMKNYIKRLQETFPGILFAGEGLHELNVEVLPLAQIHGIDSIAEIHGIEGKTNWRFVHPVSTYLFGKYTRYVAHLLTKHPTHPMFKFQENAYKKLNVIPALCLYDYKQKIEIPEVKMMIKRTEKK
ncbi:DUF6259 domain-containing protein [Ignavibacteria bacterium 4148-Me]|uniref:DUF6259 domain-containing protein n=1 Tax=Rosettibacter primus TaxID=3111523 RepID=UPI00336BB9BA